MLSPLDGVVIGQLVSGYPGEPNEASQNVGQQSFNVGGCNAR